MLDRIQRTALLLCAIAAPAQAHQQALPGGTGASAQPATTTSLPTYAALLAQGRNAQSKGVLSDAIAYYASAITREPRKAEGYKLRAQAYAVVGNDAAALADVAVGLQLEPGWLGGFVVRAEVLRSMGRPDEAVAEVERLGAMKDNVIAQQRAGITLSTFERYDLADVHFRRALAIQPDPGILVTRAQFYRPDAVATRLSDLNIVLRAQPDRISALELKGDVQRLSGDAAGAVATYSEKRQNQSAGGAGSRLPPAWR